MRLSAVTRSCPLLISRVAVGGSATSWAVQEFSAQMRAVCKIAVHRQSNLASFLAQHGKFSITLFLLTSEFVALPSPWSFSFSICFFSELISPQLPKL
jgi:hypothetical protein